MLERFRNLRVAQKMGVLIAIMVVPIVIVAGMFVSLRSELVRTYQTSQESLVFYEQIPSLLRDLALHRGLTNRALAGDSAARSQLAAVRPQIEAELASLQKLDETLGRRLGVTQEFSLVRQGWAELSQKSAGVNAAVSFEMHSKLIAQVLELMRKTGDASLILEPELSSYHLAEAVVVSLPNLIEYMSQVRDHGSGILVKKNPNFDERIDLAQNSGAARQLVNKIRIGFNVSFANDATYSSKIGPDLVRAGGAVEGYLQRTYDEIVKKEQMTDSSKEFFDDGTGAVEALLKLYGTINAAYLENLKARIWAGWRDIAIQVIVTMLGVALAMFIARWIGQAISNQISAITGLFSNIGMGNFDARADVQSEDDLGVVAASMNGMLDNLMGLIQSQDEKEKLEESIQQLVSDISVVAEGDLTAEAKVSSEVTGSIADSINVMITHLRDVISRVQNTTLAVNSSANEVQATTEHLASGSEHQAMQIAEASAAIDEVAVSIQRVAANADTAATVAGQAQQIAKTGSSSVNRTIQGMTSVREQVQQTAKRMKRLGESSQEIGEIVQLIGGIADRTSILALNASVQAAAAGEAGKTFAVVAEEVEALADRSAEATKKISGLIKSIQTETNHVIAAMEETTREVVSGSSLANEAGQRLTEIEQVSNQLAELIQSITMAAKQQTRGSESVSKTMSDISGITQQTAAGAKQAAVSIQKLAELATELRSSMAKFRLPKVAA